MINKSETIFYIKGLSIISVICAHCNSVPAESNEFARIESLILQNLGTLGVICFFVLSGMLFHYRPGKMRDFFKKRLKTLCIPWFLSATCVYLYVYLRNSALSIRSWINFVIGNGSYCYYMTILMLLYLIFTVFPFMRTNIAFSVCEIITVLSSVCFYQWGNFTPYLNILNWIGYFALGMQIRKNRAIFVQISKKILQRKYVWICLYLLIIIFQVYRGSGSWYWKGFHVIACWSGAIAIFSIANMLCSQKDNLVGRFIFALGEESFAIYIWHIPIAGIVANVMSKGILVNFVIIRPIIVAVIILFVLLFAKKMFQKVNLQKVVPIIGIRF